MTVFSRARRLLSSLARCERGTTAIEFGLIGTMVISLSVGIVQVGRGLQIRNDLARATDMGAREVLLKGPATSAVLDQAFQNEVKDAWEDDALLAFQPPQTQVVNGMTYRVYEASYPFVLLIPGVTSSPFNISVRRRVPIGL